MDSHKGCPAFFKFFSPETSIEQLILPSGIRGKLPKRVFLKDRHHNYWQVKVGKIGNRMYFQGGWATYVKDSLVQSCDMLVFQYLMDGLFNVTMFDPSSLEKDGAKKFTFKGIEGTESIGEEIEHEEEEEEYIEVVGEDDVEVEGENNEEEDSEEEMEEEDMEEVDEDDIEMEEEEDVMEVGGEGNVAEGIAIVTSSRKKRITDIYGEELFQSGLAVKPINPYFLT